MSLKERIDADLKTALLARRSEEVTTLRGLKAAILSEEVAKGEREKGLPDAEIEKVIAREIKKRRESVEIYQQNGRQELADGELMEMEILGRYLPEQLTEEQIVGKIDAVLSSLPEGQATNMGVVMGALKGELGNSADMGVVSKLLRERLGAK